MSLWLRRPLALLALLALAVGACDGDTTAPDDDDDGRPAGFLVGGDVSALARIEQGGGTFRDGATTGDALEILRAHGANLFRLRLFVDPSGQEVQVNDLDYTIALAQRVVASGARFMLDIHYSDTWADPGHQVTPAAWQGMGIDTLEQTVEDYTFDVITALDAAGAMPDIVQIGNEVDAGMLWPLGRIGGAGFDSAANFQRFGRLLKAGIRGVRSASVATDSVRVMIHYSQGASVNGTRWFFDHVRDQNVAYDMIGLSYYPWWHGSLINLNNNLVLTAARYDKDVMVVETQYPWRADWSLPIGGNSAAMIWPESAAGQANFLRAVIDVVARVPNGRGKGVVWWYPESIQVEGLFVWGGGALALFDGARQVLPAASVFGEN